MSVIMRSMSSEQWGQISPILAASCSELLSSCGVTPAVSTAATGSKAADDGTPELAAFLGFTGDQVRGTMTIITSAAFVVLIHPFTGLHRPTSEGDLRDWLGEIANQTLGRFKTQLSTRGASFEMSTPKCLGGTGLRVMQPDERPPNLLIFSAEKSEFHLHFDAQVAPGMDFSQIVMPAEGNGQEGDLVFF